MSRKRIKGALRKVEELISSHASLSRIAAALAAEDYNCREFWEDRFDR